MGEAVIKSTGIGDMNAKHHMLDFLLYLSNHHAAHDMVDRQNERAQISQDVEKVIREKRVFQTGIQRNRVETKKEIKTSGNGPIEYRFNATQKGWVVIHSDIR